MPFLNPHGDISIAQRKLPHRRQSEVTYFITFRLADSIPQEKLRSWKAERAAFLARNPFPHSPDVSVRYHQRFTVKIEEWLDSEMGSCLFKKRERSQIVADTLLFFDQKRYQLGEWVIMPNHVHAVVTPQPGFDLTEILHSWKSYSATQLNQLANREGPLWQEESFNQILRNEQHLWSVKEYIRNNPTKAGVAIHHASFLNQK